MNVYMGDIGADPHEIEFEPFVTPAVPEPIYQPQQQPAQPAKAPEPELVPA